MTFFPSRHYLLGFRWDLRPREKKRVKLSTSEKKHISIQGSLNYSTHFFWGGGHPNLMLKYMVILRDFPYYCVLFGLVIYWPLLYLDLPFVCQISAEIHLPKTYQKKAEILHKTRRSRYNYNYDLFVESCVWTTMMFSLFRKIILETGWNTQVGPEFGGFFSFDVHSNCFPILASVVFSNLNLHPKIWGRWPISWPKSICFSDKGSSN